MNVIMLFAFACYFFILAAISLMVKKRQETAQSYILGNRSVNYWVTAVATQASDMGSWLFLAFPAAVYANGLFEYWAAIGLITFMFLNWRFVAGPLRRETAQYNAVTLTSYFSKKYNDTSGLIGLIGSIITLFFFTFYIASGLVGLGRLFDAAFSLDYHIGICLGLLTVVLYTLIGGFVAVAWCDFFQGLFLLGVIVAVPVYTLFILGGIQPIIASAAAHNISLSLFPADKSVLSALFLAASWGLGYFGQPHILVNFMGIDDADNTTQATYVGMVWQVIVLTASACIGLVGLGFYPHGLAHNENLFIDLAQTLFVPLIAGCALCAILAATLSTMDSHILVSGATYAEDFYRFFYPKAKSPQLVWVSRCGSILVSLVALIIAWNNNNTVYALVNYAWSGLGSAFGPLVLLSLYCGHRITRKGAIAGIVTGALVAGMLPLFAPTVFPLVPGFFASLFVLWFAF